MNAFPRSPGVLLAIYSVFVIFASLAGGWLLLAMRLTHTRLQVAVSFVAGLMLSMALLHFLPHALEQNGSIKATVWGVLLGFLAMFFLQRFFPHHHHDVPENAPESRAGEEAALAAPTLTQQSAGMLSWTATAVGMTLHSLIGGMALGAAVGAGARGGGIWVGLGTALIIILHKPFDAMAVTTLMTASGCSRFFRHLINGLFSLATPLGAGLFYAGIACAAGNHPELLGGALAFCAGTFLCIAGADLLPELQFHSHDRFKLSLALLAGVGAAILIGILGAAQVHGHPPAGGHPPLSSEAIP
ncbi:MAG: ZIP family metal transporter [Verrucomicrobiae bacterium]|nr:ZIP family metal transporter [Verrucomicrobiae bacterium]